MPNPCVRIVGMARSYKPMAEPALAAMLLD